MVEISHQGLQSGSHNWRAFERLQKSLKSKEIKKIANFKWKRGVNS